MDETEHFIYEVEQAIDIHYEDDEHHPSSYMHTAVIGRLREGVMHVGDVIVMPGEQGTIVIGYVRMMEVYHKQWRKIELTAEEASRPMAVFVRVEAPRPTNIQNGLAKGYLRAQYQAYLLRSQ